VSKWSHSTEDHAATPYPERDATAKWLASRGSLFEEKDRWGRFLSRDPTLDYMNALATGDPDARIVL
jgi:hypothetical protein